MSVLVAIEALDDEACWSISERLDGALRARRAGSFRAARVAWTVRELLRNSERRGGNGGPASVSFEAEGRVVVRIPGPQFDSVAAAATSERALGLAASMLKDVGVRWEYEWADGNLISFSWDPGGDQ